MKDLQATKGRYYIQRLIDEGEHEHQDFKFAISDARKIARSVSAFANNDGGRLLIGVKDNGAIAGVRNDEDIYVVEQAAQTYCQPAVDVKFDAYKINPGVIVIKATVPTAVRRPVSVREADGQLRAYFRVADENIAAHPLMVRAWRLRADSDSIPLRLDAEATAVLAAIDAAGTQPLTAEQIAYAAHISQQMADTVTARLAAVGVLTFAYTGHTFGIVRNRD